MTTARNFMTLLDSTLKESKEGSDVSLIAKFEEVKSANVALIAKSTSSKDLQDLLKGINKFRETMLDDLKDQMEQMAEIWEGSDDDAAKKTIQLAAQTKAIQEKLIKLDRLVREQIKALTTTPKEKPKPVPIAAEKKRAAPRAPTEDKIKVVSKKADVTLESVKDAIDQLNQKIKKQGVFNELVPLLEQLCSDLDVGEYKRIESKLKINDESSYQKLNELQRVSIELRKKLSDISAEAKNLQKVEIDRVKSQNYTNAIALLTKTNHRLEDLEKSLVKIIKIKNAKKAKQDTQLKKEIFTPDTRLRVAKADAQTTSLFATLQAVQSKNPFNRQSRAQQAQQAFRKWLKSQELRHDKIDNKKFEASVISYQNANNLTNEQMIQRLFFMSNLVRGQNSAEFSRGLTDSQLHYLDEFNVMLNDTAAKIRKFSAESQLTTSEAFSGSIVGTLEVLDRFDWSKDMHKIANALKTFGKEEFVIIEGALHAYQAKHHLSNEKMIAKIDDFKNKIAHNFPKDSTGKDFNKRLEKVAVDMKKLPKNSVPADLKDQVIRRIDHVVELKAGLINEMRKFKSQEDYSDLKDALTHDCIMGTQGTDTLDKARATLLKAACVAFPKFKALRDNYRALDEVEQQLRKGGSPEVLLEESDRVMLKRRTDFKGAATASQETKNLLTAFLTACSSVGKFLIDLFHISQAKQVATAKAKIATVSQSKAKKVDTRKPSKTLPIKPPQEQMKVNQVAKTPQQITEELKAHIDDRMAELTDIKAQARQRVLDEISQAIYEKIQAQSGKPTETGTAEQKIAAIAKAVESQKLVNIIINAMTLDIPVDPDIEFKFQGIGMQDEKGAATITFTPAQLDEVLVKKKGILEIDSNVFQTASKTLSETRIKLGKKPDGDQINYLQTIANKLDQIAATIIQADPKLKSRQPESKQAAIPKSVAKITNGRLFTKKGKPESAHPGIAAANRYKH